MSYKYFYLLLLLMISIVSVVFLSLLFAELKKNRNPEIKATSNAVLFIILAYVSWIIVVLSKFFDIDELNLKYVINDRIFSSLSNLFFVLSLVYFPGFRQYIKIKWNIIPERWVLGSFVLFAFLISLLSLLDKMKSDAHDFFPILIIVLDSLISVSVILLLGLALYKGFQMLSSNKLFKNHLLIVIVGFSFSQILLPVVKIFPEILSDYYPYFLALFLTFLMAITQVFFMFFSIFTFSSVGQGKNSQPFISEFSDLEEFSSIHTIELDYKQENQIFTLKISGFIKDNIPTQIEIKYAKITQPVLYWFLFSIGKIKNVKLYHTDMAILKFRMVEFWNKNADVRLNQDVLFLNDNSRFEFSAKDIILSRTLLHDFISKLAVKDLIKKHFICFVDDFIIKEKNLLNKKNLDSFIDDNFQSFYIELKDLNT